MVSVIYKVQEQAGSQPDAQKSIFSMLLKMEELFDQLTA
jgi:hypothetical protein